MRALTQNLYLSIGIVLFIFTISCVRNNNSSEQNKDSISVSSRVDSQFRNTILWTYDVLGDSMVKNVIPDSLYLEVVLDTLNRRYNTADLQFEKQLGDTLFLNINDVSFLQKMGSSGNYGFMAEVIYSLTELPNVNYVYLNFEQLDHATPGIYTREDFDNKIIP